MKNKFVLIFALLCSMQMMAVDLVVQTRTGTDLTNDIAIIGKWMFENQNLLLIGKDGTILAQEPIDNVRKIIFTKNPSTDVSNIVDSNMYIVYPNPTQDALHIKGATDTTPVRVYTMDGKLVNSTKGQIINVQSLATGTYLLQIGTQVARFIKE